MSSPVQTVADPAPADLTEPVAWPDGNRRLLTGAGDFIEPLIRLGTFSSEKFEVFATQWAWYTLRSRYAQVQRHGGAGDKGRDVIGWLDPSGTPGRRWDNYQCKHYAQPLTPSDFALEVAKLAYYTHRGDFTLPQRYVIVTHKGVGPKLAEFLAAPERLRQDVKDKWETCSRNICRGQKIDLDSSLEAHLDAIDFSIFQELPPTQLLAEHCSNVPFHPMIFGTGLAPRPPHVPPPVEVGGHEVMYVGKIFAAIAQHIGTRVSSPEAFRTRNDVTWQFNHARECFYSAEALEKFARDSLPDFPTVAKDLAGEVHQGISIALHRSYDDGYQRMLDVCEKVQQVSLRRSVLAEEMLPNDRVGVLHQLANDNHIDWVDP